MGECFITRRGGGSELNLRVLGGAGQPTTARENDIWVETNVAITDWSISPTEPANKIQGMAWIYSAQDAVYGLKVFRDGGVIIYPTGCMQWNGGGWVKRPISIFMNGLWRVISCPIYQDGDEFTAITGGWEPWREWGSCKFEKTATRMNLVTTIEEPSFKHTCVVSHRFPIDFKRFRKLRAVCTMNGKNQINRTAEMFVANERTLTSSNPVSGVPVSPDNFVTQTSATGDGPITLTINLEGLNLSNAKYVVFRSSTRSESILSISKVELLY